MKLINVDGEIYRLRKIECGDECRHYSLSRNLIERTKKQAIATNKPT